MGRTCRRPGRGHTAPPATHHECDSLQLPRPPAVPLSGSHNHPTPAPKEAPEQAVPPGLYVVKADVPLAGRTFGKGFPVEKRQHPHQGNSRVLSRSTPQGNYSIISVNAGDESSSQCPLQCPCAVLPGRRVPRDRGGWEVGRKLGLKEPTKGETGPTGASAVENRLVVPHK